jgi:tetratricopeptide (TPR) repeat protein
MTKKKLTGIGFGTPLVSASLSWERADAASDLGLGVEKGCLVLPGGKLPAVRQVLDPIMMGVHPSSVVHGGSRPDGGEPLVERVPAYVPRDADEDLRRRLADSGFVVLVGDSSAGKSRAAFEAVTAVLPDHVLIVPQNGDAVAAAISAAEGTRRCVLWLDDLEKYVGPGGLTRVGVARIMAGRRAHRVIVATLRAAEEALLTSDAAGEEGGWQSRRDAREAIELAHRIPLSRLFSKPELERANAYAWDPRIAEALAHADMYGVAEYMAAGPELLRDWEDAWSPNTDPRTPSHPRGAALVAAATDLRRGGFTSPLPCRMIEKVHEHYLRERGGARLRPEPLRDAWAWAARARRATTALLQPVDDEHVQVFDYLLDAVQRSFRPGDHVPDSILDAALGVCAAIDADNIARTAGRNGRYQLAGKASYQAHRSYESALGTEHRDTLAARAFHADILRELGRNAEFESEHQMVAKIAARAFGPEDPLVLESRNGRAFALIRLGRSVEAEEELRAVRDVSSRVLGAGHDVTMTSRHYRAIALGNLNQITEAEAENRLVLDAWNRDFGPEHTSTLYSRGNLAGILYRAGRYEEAESEARAVLEIRTRVLGPEHPVTLFMRSFHADILREMGRPAEAESEYRAVAEIATRAFGEEDRLALGSRSGRAFALIRLGRFAEAEQELQAVRDVSSRVLGAGHDTTLTSRHLRAIALLCLGRLAEAETENRFILDAWTREFGPEDAGTLYSRGNLARVLLDSERFEEAETEARAVLEIRMRVLGPDHPDTVYIVALVSRIESARNRSVSR